MRRRSKNRISLALANLPGWKTVGRQRQGPKDREYSSGKDKPWRNEKVWIRFRGASFRCIMYVVA
ncbi:predicted protein [Plenodomus lingam JN3]|uniref:Predicted protein n=1 Tax=Leptosphaeria maculans (strain JN3 / isolate v23.1.3 / race Av1-4-5-6-7-8) TaxID=985895 RepID=E4ZHT7_LEPMJ|nr:predicted protein [Plenodomus lingam JN3]CBX90920.1 predicted protein [Plenodomus lingam JN3]